MTTPRRITTLLTSLAMGAGALALAAPAQAARPASIGIGEAGGSFVPGIRVMTPWSGTRGSIDTGYATTIAAATVPNSAAVGTDVVATLSGLITVEGDRTLRGVYAWVSCPRPLGTTGQTAALRECTVVQSHPSGPVTIDVDKLQPVGNTWRAPAANGTLFGVTNTLRITPDMVGRYLYMNYSAQTISRAGVLLDNSVHSSEPILAMPANITVSGAPRVTTAAPAAGQPVEAQAATWPAAPAGTATRSQTSSAWVCRNPAAATSTALLWDVANGCTRLAAEAPNAVISATLPADAAGKYLLVNSNIEALPTASTQMPGSFTWVARSPAVQIAAAPGAPPVADAAAGAADAAATAAGGGGAAPAANAPAAAGGATPAAPGAVAPTAIAAGAGVDLAKAPLVGADGRGTGASAKLTLGLAASKKVNRGRYITVTAALTPKGSTGKVRIVLARTNAKGKVIPSKALFANVSKGKATKRWQIPRKYTAGNYTVVATYVPSKKGAPGATALAPVTIG